MTGYNRNNYSFLMRWNIKASNKLQYEQKKNLKGYLIADKDNGFSFIDFCVNTQKFHLHIECCGISVFYKVGCQQNLRIKKIGYYEHSQSFIKK